MQTRFRSEEKRSGYIRKQKTLPKYRRFSMVCIRRIGNGSAGAKSARRLTWLCKAEGKRSRSRAEFVGLRGGRQSAPARMGTARSSARRRLDSARLSRRRPHTPFSAQGRIHNKNLKSKKKQKGTARAVPFSFSHIISEQRGLYFLDLHPSRRVFDRPLTKNYKYGCKEGAEEAKKPQKVKQATL